MLTTVNFSCFDFAHQLVAVGESVVPAEKTINFVQDRIDDTQHSRCALDESSLLACCQARTAVRTEVIDCQAAVGEVGLSSLSALAGECSRSVTGSSFDRGRSVASRSALSETSMEAAAGSAGGFMSFDPVGGTTEPP
ncbi:unnamed protein product [Lampetra planeri]